MRDILKSIKAYLQMEKEGGVTEYLFSSKPKKQGLESLKQETMQCQKCSLAKTRHNVVFGSGSTKAKLMFVGEAPGYDEDMQGQPFVGKAGMLLTKIIEAMGLKRQDVYICNIL